MGEITSKKQRRINTDKRIINSALLVFGEKGYTRATLSEIAKKAGVSSGLIVQNFKGKDELLVKILENKVLDLSVVLNEADNWKDALINICNHVILLTQNKIEDGKLSLKLYSVLLNSTDTPASAVKTIFDGFSKVSLIKLIKDGQEKGEVIKGDALKILALFFRTTSTVLANCSINNLLPPDISWFINLVSQNSRKNG